jgi:adenine-specific DNA-methyltransferase
MGAQVGVRYIGSKARVAELIAELAGAPTPGGRFVDAFSGTGVVAAAAAARGWAVTVNDQLPSAVAMSVGTVVGSGNVAFAGLGGYRSAIAALDAEPGRPGFLHAQYSPASAGPGTVERRYFTEENAARLDAMRALVRTWAQDGQLSFAEEQLLLADLIQAANSVANISGTYGCFLKNWTSGALRPVRVGARPLPDRTTDFMSTTLDVFNVQTTEEDTVYLDPPYTKRQYSAYYHLLETLHAGDTPHVEGVTGLRPWHDRASVFCYKTKALDALTRLILGVRARRVLLSYSTEGHVPKRHLVNALREAGDVTVHELSAIGRYRPNAQASAAGDKVHEYLIEVTPVSADEEPVGVPAKAVFA